MHIPRIYSVCTLQPHQEISLNTAASGHLLRVLRLQIGDKLTLFDGQQEYDAVLTAIKKKTIAVVTTSQRIDNKMESPLDIHLGQAILRHEKMDYILQKTVELGVKKITPLLTDNSQIKLTTERLEKRLSHWHDIIIQACEQSGRCHLPELLPAISLVTWLSQETASLKCILHPQGTQHLHALTPATSVAIAVGPESGFNDKELRTATHYGWHTLCLGPRILRTETAGPAAIAGLQCVWGDMF